MVDDADLKTEFARLAAPLVADPEVLTTLIGASRARRVAKGDHLVRQGDRVSSLHFIVSGLVRYYYLADGTEYTGQFFDEGKLVADVFAMTTGGEALQNIDALEDSDLIEIPRVALQSAFDSDHAMERVGRRIMEEVMAGSQRRTASLLQLNPEERYSRFVQMRPEVARRVPQYLIASYLGITPEALSRIRARRTRT